ncbi:unnamed protein product [Amoebophrya sp. A120]|nr:unnamed protein product [Amoebophrya sp. A120]|eukprot:GSA120T00012306001.1
MDAHWNFRQTRPAGTRTADGPANHLTVTVAEVPAANTGRVSGSTVDAIPARFTRIPGPLSVGDAGSARTHSNSGGLRDSVTTLPPPVMLSHRTATEIEIDGDAEAKRQHSAVSEVRGADRTNANKSSYGLHEQIQNAAEQARVASTPSESQILKTPPLKKRQPLVVTSTPRRSVLKSSIDDNRNGAKSSRSCKSSSRVRVVEPAESIRYTTTESESPAHDVSTRTTLQQEGRHGKSPQSLAASSNTSSSSSTSQEQDHDDDELRRTTTSTTTLDRPGGAQEPHMTHGAPRGRNTLQLHNGLHARATATGSHVQAHLHSSDASAGFVNGNASTPSVPEQVTNFASLGGSGFFRFPMQQTQQVYSGPGGSSSTVASSAPGPFGSGSRCLSSRPGMIQPPFLQQPTLMPPAFSQPLPLVYTGI